MSFNALPPFDPKTGLLNVIIETPRGSRNKYSYDSALQIFKLKKVLTLGAVFPFDFGFVPSTLSEDGDPLDVLVIMDEPAFSGCLVQARLIGNIEGLQTNPTMKKRFRNDRLIAMAQKNLLHCQVNSLADLDRETLDQIEHFFISYNEMEDKKFKPVSREGPKEARKLIEQAQRKCNQKYAAIVPSNRHQ